MTIRTAELALRVPLRFGDEVQIDALRVIGLRNELNGLLRRHAVKLMCSGCPDGCNHDALNKWDEAVLEAQIARIRLLMEDGPDLTGDQREAMWRA